MTKNSRIVRIPILERVVLEGLAERWQVTADEALTLLIRQAAWREVTRQQPQQGQPANQKHTLTQEVR